MHLRIAPIREAIVDIQGVSPSASDPDALLGAFKAAHEQVKGTHPSLEEVVQRDIAFAAVGTPTINALLLGYLFRSGAKPQTAIQFRRAGYAFSWMNPYKDWDSLIEGARKGWDVYRKIRPDFSISRIAVRYINQLTIPFPLSEADQFLVGIPKPQTNPNAYSNLKAFAEQQITLDTPSGATVGLVRLVQEPAADGIETQAIIDIDVYREVTIPPADADRVWDLLPTFQKVKNEVFYKCIGPAAIRACGGEE